LFSLKGKNGHLTMSRAALTYHISFQSFAKTTTLTSKINIVTVKKRGVTQFDPFIAAYINFQRECRSSNTFIIQMPTPRIITSQT